jgi:hypothetical protein
MEEDCGGGQGLSWAVELRRERTAFKRFSLNERSSNKKSLRKRSGSACRGRIEIK